jgi:hypothetical protein
MTLAAKITYPAMLIVGLCVGAWFGFRMTTHVLQRHHDAQEMAAPLAFDEFATAEYRFADAKHAKAALEASANFSEKVERLRPDKGREIALSVAYTRLALVADSVRDPEQSQFYMAKARRWLPAGGRQDASDAEIKAARKALDERLFASDWSGPF